MAKSREILASIDPKNDPYNLSCVRVRLGDFQLLMSFLGSIEFIKDGFRLREAFCEIYVALMEQAYSRAIKGQFLVQLALTQITLSVMDLTDIEKIKIDALLLDLGEENFMQKLNQKEFIDWKKKFIEHVKVIKNRGPITQPWLQYLATIKDFIRAERSENWFLHLKCVERMRLDIFCMLNLRIYIYKTCEKFSHTCLNTNLTSLRLNPFLLSEGIITSGLEYGLT